MDSLETQIRKKVEKRSSRDLRSELTAGLPGLLASSLEVLPLDALQDFVIRLRLLNGDKNIVRKEIPQSQGSHDLEGEVITLTLTHQSPDKAGASDDPKGDPDKSDDDDDDDDDEDLGAAAQLFTGEVSPMTAPAGVSPEMMMMFQMMQLQILEDKKERKRERKEREKK